MINSFRILASGRARRKRCEIRRVAGEAGKFLFRRRYREGAKLRDVIVRSDKAVVKRSFGRGAALVVLESANFI